VPGPTSSQLYTWNGALNSGKVIQDAFGNNIVVGPVVPGGAAANNVLLSDANGYLTNAPLPAAGVPATLNTTTFASGFQVPEGSNAYMGTVAVNGTNPITVATTALSANSRIFMTINVPGGTPGSPYVFSQSAATNFVVKSQASDTSTVAWLIINHT
jgi:hypothetical protein